MEISETELPRMKERLGIVTDKRRRGWHFLYNLVDILVIGLSAALCGWTAFEQMEELGLEREDFFKRFLELPNEPSDRRFSPLPSVYHYRRGSKRGKTPRLLLDRVIPGLDIQVSV